MFNKKNVVYIVALNFLLMFKLGLADTRQELFTNYSSAVVSIAVLFFYEDSTTECSYGTGFLISSDGYMLTTDHIFRKKPKFKVVEGERVEIPVVKIEPTIILEHPNNCDSTKRRGSIFDITLVERSEDLDIAVYKISSLSTIRILINSFVVSCYPSESPKVGDDIFTIGYVSETGPHVDSGVYEAIPLPHFGGMVSIKTKAEEGESGSPVFNEDSLLLGMISKDVPDRHEFAIMIPLSHMNNYLEKYGNFSECENGGDDISDSCIIFTKTEDTSFVSPRSKGFQNIVNRKEVVMKAMPDEEILDIAWFGVKSSRLPNPAVTISDFGESAKIRFELLSGPTYNNWTTSVRGVIVALFATGECSDFERRQARLDFESSKNFYQLPAD